MANIRHPPPASPPRGWDAAPASWVKASDLEGSASYQFGPCELVEWIDLTPLPRGCMSQQGSCVPNTRG